MSDLNAKIVPDDEPHRSADTSKHRLMSREQYEEFDRTGELTDEWVNAGWHFCLELDPFIGSGTTAAVAQKCGCKFVGCELNATYLDLAAKRFRQRGLPFDVA